MIGGLAKHVTEVGRVTACVLPVGLWHSHVEGLLVARTDVRCATSVRMHKGAIADYSVKFPQCISYIQSGPPKSSPPSVLHVSL
jgi:hypothetical protein